MAAGVGLQLAVNNYTLNVCNALRSCEVHKDVEGILRNLLLFVCLSTEPTNVDSRSNIPAPASPLELSYARVLHESQSKSNAAHVLEALLFQQMESITFSLLPGIVWCHICCTAWPFHHGQSIFHCTMRTQAAPWHIACHKHVC